MQKTYALIVGAGPTGLMLACQLTLQDIPFIIVEKESGPTTQSRALGIQARSVEIFSQMGISDTFLKEGFPAQGAEFVSEGKKVEEVSFSDFGKGLTEFDFLLMLEQSKTEQILINFLEKHKKKILWNTEVTSFTQHATGVKATIKSKDKEEEIEADWILGADGAHSIVRHTIGIPLAGKTYKQSLFVLDCKIDSQLSRDKIAVVFSRKAFAAFFPMSRDRWRIVGEIPDTLIGKDTITFEDVNADFAQRLNMDITLSDPAWISLYHSHHRCVSSFHKDRWFLLGDAANIHSPVGAQGMNTGLQDAYNLAWKLGFVYHKKAKEDILNTYNAERLPFAKKLVETTDRVFSVAISRNPVSIVFREHIIPFLIKIASGRKFSRDFIFRTISQIGINYRPSPLSHHASVGDFPDKAPRPGDRLPYLFFGDKNLQHLVSVEKCTLFLFADEMNEEIKQFTKTYDKIINTILIPKSGNEKLYNAMGIKNTGYYLVRPDVYIAFRSTEIQVTVLENYLLQFFVV